MKNRFAFWGIVCSVILLVLVSTNSPALSEAESIKIACVGELAGAMAEPQGKNHFSGFQLAVKEFNDKGGVLGRKVECIDIHEGYTSEEVIGAFKKAISKKPAAIIGGTEAGTCDAAAPYLKDAGIPYVVSYASPSKPSKPGWDPKGFRLPYSAAQYWTTYKAFIEKGKYKRVGLLTIDAGYGYQCSDLLKGWFPDGAPVQVTDVIFYPWGTANTDQEITKLAAGKPDLVILGMWGKSISVPAIKKLRELGYKGDILMDVDCVTEGDVSEMPSRFEDVYGMTGWIEDRTDKANAEFSDAVRAHTDVSPNLQTALTYTGMKGLLKAIELAGTADDPDKIADAMFKIKWDTPLGDKWFLFPGGQFYMSGGIIRQAQKGKLVPVFKYKIPMEAYCTPNDWYGAYLKEKGKK